MVLDPLQIVVEPVTVKVGIAFTVMVCDAVATQPETLVPVTV